MSTLQLADAKTHLNINVGTYDVELQSFVAAAEALMADRVGPLTAASVTSRVRGYTRSLALPQFPVVSIQSVTPVGGTALDIATLQFVPDSVRLVEYIVTGGYFASPWYDVVYTAGRTVSATVNADIYKNGLELVRRMWATQRGRAGQPLTQGASPGDFAAAADEIFKDDVPVGIG
jgi:hypothetical protein